MSNVYVENGVGETCSNAGLVYVVHFNVITFEKGMKQSPPNCMLHRWINWNLLTRLAANQRGVFEIRVYNAGNSDVGIPNKS